MNTVKSQPAAAPTKKRPRPAKFRHNLQMSLSLFHELSANGVIDSVGYYVNQDAFIEFTPDDVIISFTCLYQAEDLHRKIDFYLVRKAYGFYPIKRIGISKL